LQIANCKLLIYLQIADLLMIGAGGLRGLGEDRNQQSAIAAITHSVRVGTLCIRPDPAELPDIMR
jgi:hypothetical protein